MKKQAIALMIVFSALLISNISLFAAGGNMGGPTQNGSAEHPYLIEDFNDFQVFCSNCDYWATNINTKLTCNLDLDPDLPVRETYTIAPIAPDGSYFRGVFDGNDNIISNLTINAEGADYKHLGLFGQIKDPNAEVKHLNIENVNITGGAESIYTAGLCGANYGGTISHCYATGQITSYNTVGILCGFNRTGIIKNCCVNGEVNGNEYLGGLCGINYLATIEECYATGNINGNDHLGGLCGINISVITNSYADCNVTGNDYIGGLCGYNGNFYFDPIKITNCYATGKIIGNSYLGGLCGYNEEGTINNCYSTVKVLGNSNTGGLCGYNEDGIVSNAYYHMFGGINNDLGIALDDLQMQDANSFIGFDFISNPNDGNDGYWDIVNGHCPKLSWQIDDGPSTLPDPPVTSLTGSGYSHDPFQINSYEDFTEFRTNAELNCGYYILNTDIDLSGETFTTAVINRNFGGYFDGNNHVISNINIDTNGEDYDYLGLFNKISASVSNLGLEDVNLIGKEYKSDYLGGVCGFNDHADIINCYVTGSVNGDDYLGGLCGYNNYGNIINCYANISINGDNDLGGICGKNYGTINNCHATSSITGNDYLGGICGYNNHGTIINCYATGLVTGDDCLGEICGQNDGTINNCHATGSITGDESLGGIAGSNYSEQSSIINCHAFCSVTGGIYSKCIGGLCGSNGWIDVVGGTISECYATGVVVGNKDLGGLCGFNRGPITNCYTNVDVNGIGDYSHYNGGLCGENYNGTINNCYAIGNVTGYHYLGGFCGENYEESEINNCYAMVTVTGYSFLGGFCAENSKSMIINCYSTGAAIGDGTNVGGFCGNNISSSAITISNCFWNKETSGLASSSGGQGKTTQQIKTETTFTDVGWDFTNVWWINDQRDYPKLSYQPFGDLNNDCKVNFYDYAAFSLAWQTTEGETYYNSICEFSGDNTIDEFDLATLAENWLQ